MASGGYRSGAGRKKKPVAEKILTGNPGKRPIEFVDYTNAPEITDTPPEELEPLSTSELKIYKFIVDWLTRMGVTRGVLTIHIYIYAKSLANWMHCSKMVATHGMLYKKKDNAEESPYIEIGKGYLKDANDAWAEIAKVVRESNTKEYSATSANDEIMESILSGSFDNSKPKRKEAK